MIRRRVLLKGHVNNTTTRVWLVILYFPYPVGQESDLVGRHVEASWVSIGSSAGKKRDEHVLSQELS